MIYTAQITMRIPVELQAIANSIGKAFDPDTGGDKTFNIAPVDGFITTTFPCVPDFADALSFFLESPVYLHASVLRDYETRWVELTPPTLLDCEEFCSGVVIVLPSVELPEYVPLGS